MFFEVRVQDRDTQTHKAQAVTLDGQRFVLDTYTNKIDNKWYLDIRDELNEIIITGLRLTVGLKLLFPYRTLAVPAGELFVQSRVYPAVDPTLDSFELRTHALMYQSVTTESTVTT